jgi:hypothetical protein
LSAHAVRHQELKHSTGGFRDAVQIVSRPPDQVPLCELASFSTDKLVMTQRRLARAEFETEKLLQAYFADATRGSTWSYGAPANIGL